ncbi:MAG: 5-oxoprolinase subunit PxpB [Betaproteobacteria bacterium]|nr:5-oxoprolinase subunit PxpB [Betaproteobacteria bacterium]MBL8533271.1 5-oxoprolinase subunit PxpB [Betaproteobacteria bacterium]
MAAAPPDPQIFPLGDRALVVEFGTIVDASINARARAFAEHLLTIRVPCVNDVVPGYACVTVHFDPMAACEAFRTTEPLEALRAALSTALQKAPLASKRKARTIEIPVCYGGDHGADLEDVARQCNLPAEEVVRLHTAPLYQVYTLGFVPGFGYLGGLDSRLRCPRRQAPRKRVPAGSVGIGGEQTGVYPLETPGGWNLIGRTPRKLVQLSEEGAQMVLQAGDEVRFVPISGAEYDRLKASQR